MVILLDVTFAIILALGYAMFLSFSKLLFSRLNCWKNCEYNQPKRVLLIKFVSKSSNRIVMCLLTNYVLNWIGSGCLTILVDKPKRPNDFNLWETAPLTRFMMLGQTYVNEWSRVVASQNGGSTSYIFPFRLRVLQWSRHLFNYWKNKKTII